MHVRLINLNLSTELNQIIFQRRDATCCRCVLALHTSYCMISPQSPPLVSKIKDGNSTAREKAIARPKNMPLLQATQCNVR